jgi:hypothetical protein
MGACTARKTLIGINKVVAHRFGATPLTGLAAWKILPRHHGRSTGAVIVRPTMLPVGGPTRGYDARVNRSVGQNFHTTDTSIMVALETCHATCERWMEAWQDFPCQH